MIRKRLVLVAMILLIPAMAMGAPFLTCDNPPPEDQVTHYMVGTERVDSLTVGKAIWYDLASIPDGEFSLQVRACNVWGCSPVAPFVSRRAVPSTPAGWRIVTGY